jgi:putative transposase
MIESEKACFGTRMMCRTLGVSSSGYYAWASRGPSARALENVALGTEVEAIHQESRTTYGSPRVHEELRDRGKRVSRKRVARLMRERELRARTRRRFRRTTDSSHSDPIAPNVLDRHFMADAPDQCWVGDITYLWTGEGWLYLAVLLDLYSRRVIGWSMSESLHTELALGALQMALGHREAQGVLHHSDRGCQRGF